MATIQVNFRQFLFPNVADALIEAFPDNTDQLLDGITYRQGNKVWNIMVAWDKDLNEDIQGVFIRVLSADTFYGYHFTRNKELSNADDTYLTHRTVSYHFPDDELKTSIEHQKITEIFPIGELSATFKDVQLAPTATVPSLNICELKDNFGYRSFTTFPKYLSPNITILTTSEVAQLKTTQLNQALEKHLPTVVYQAIHDKFGEDPSDLFKQDPYNRRDEGVKFEYDGKIWNVKVGFLRDETDEVTDVFIRAHSSDTIFGSHFSARPSDKVYYRLISIYPEGIRDFNTGENGYPKDYQAGNIDVTKILNLGERKPYLNDDPQHPDMPPVVTESMIDRSRQFFEHCPDLLPPRFSRQQPPQDNNLPSQFISAVAIVSGLATLYFGYKTIQNASQYLKGENSSIWSTVNKIIPMAIFGFIFSITAPSLWQNNPQGE